MRGVEAAIARARAAAVTPPATVAAGAGATPAGPAAADTPDPGEPTGFGSPVEGSPARPTPRPGRSPGTSPQQPQVPRSFSDTFSRATPRVAAAAEAEIQPAPLPTSYPAPAGLGDPRGFAFVPVERPPAAEAGQQGPAAVVQRRVRFRSRSDQTVLPLEQPSTAAALSVAAAATAGAAMAVPASQAADAEVLYYAAEAAVPPEVLGPPEAEVTAADITAAEEGGFVAQPASPVTAEPPSSPLRRRPRRFSIG